MPSGKKKALDTVAANVVARLSDGSHRVVRPSKGSGLRTAPNEARTRKGQPDTI